MIVECHSCGATYNISDEKIRGRRVRVRCKSCSEGIIVDGTRVDSDEATRVYSPTFEPGMYAARVHDEATRVMAPSGPDLRAAAGGDEWTVAIGESERRTMDLAELVSSYTGGLIPDDALVWREGMDDWLPIREVPEVKSAIESNEATHVVSPAIAVRAPRRASGDRTGAHRMEPEAEPPPRARMASLSEFSEPVAPVAPRARAASVAEVRAPAPAPVARAARLPSARPPADERPIAAARVREGRAAGGTDLFGNIEAAGGEEALLGSSALSQYDEKPIGARNESSVLFSLDALKAGARRGSSAPPRMPSSPPQTAADILGMTAGGALPGISASSSLLSAPMMDAPLAAVPTTPPRSKMDTLPPTMRARRTWPLPAIVVLGALVVGGAAFLVLRNRLGGQARIVEATSADGETPARATAAPDPTTPVAKAAEPEPPAAPATPGAAETASPVETAAPAETAPPPPATGAHAPSQGDGVTAPVMPSKARSTSTTSNIEALKAAMRPDKGESVVTEKPASEKGAAKGTEKVVLAEEVSETETAEPAEEPPKPPFDTGAAKTALAAASASAASCKKQDGPTGTGKVQVTFSSTGRATSANVIEGPFGGTPVGGCIAKIFRAAKVPAFSGDPVTVSKSFTIPE